MDGGGPVELVLEPLLGDVLQIAVPMCDDADMTEETDLFIHDPSTIVRRGDVYYVFGTGRGITIATSTNRTAWTRIGVVLPETPA